MKKILLTISIFNILLLAFYFFAHLNVMGIKIAEPPIPGNLPNPGDDPEFVPINDYLWFLALVGIGYVGCKVRALNLQKL